jgi:hypothetical protein
MVSEKIASFATPNRSQVDPTLVFCLKPGEGVFGYLVLQKSPKRLQKVSKSRHKVTKKSPKSLQK